jgi:hypothetical protein
MKNTYLWLINSLDCIPFIDGQTNVVSCIYWRVNGTDGTYTTTVYGTQSITYVAGTPFTAYASLTEATVIEWLQTAMGTEQVTAIQSSLNSQLKTLANPPVVTPPLPWAK